MSEDISLAFKLAIVICLYGALVVIVLSLLTNALVLHNSWNNKLVNSLVTIDSELSSLTLAEVGGASIYKVLYNLQSNIDSLQITYYVNKESDVTTTTSDLVFLKENAGKKFIVDYTKSPTQAEYDIMIKEVR